MANSKTDTVILDMLSKLDRRITALSSTVDQVVGIDRMPSTDASPSRAPRLSLPEQVLKLIKQKPRATTEIMEALGISKTSAWSAIAQLERTQDAIVISTPGAVRGRRGPSVIYHPSSPELAAMLRR